MFGGRSRQTGGKLPSAASKGKCSAASSRLPSPFPPPSLPRCLPVRAPPFFPDLSSLLLLSLLPIPFLPSSFFYHFLAQLQSAPQAFPFQILLFYHVPNQIKVPILLLASKSSKVSSCLPFSDGSLVRILGL